jgi:hypothetical protein
LLIDEKGWVDYSFICKTNIWNIAASENCGAVAKKGVHKTAYLAV